MPPADGHRRRREVREFSLSPQTLAVCHRHFFRPEQRPAASREEIRTTRVSPCAFRRVRRYSAPSHVLSHSGHDCVSPGPLLHHHPRSVHIPQITAPAVSQTGDRAVMVTSGCPSTPCVSAHYEWPVSVWPVPVPR